MAAARDMSSSNETAARSHSDVEAMRKRLIELEKTRIFTDEDLAFLLRKSVQTNLKAGFESRVLNRRSGAASDRTTSGRTVIRSWSPATECDNVATAESAEVQSESHDIDGWKQFTARAVATRTIEKPAPRLQPAFDGRRIKRPTRLKSMQNRNFIVTILANIIFIPKQAVSSLVSLVVPGSTSDRRAC